MYNPGHGWHYGDVIVGTIASQITSLAIDYSTVYLDPDQRKHQSSASLAICAGNSPEAGEFPAQMASNAEDVSICWRHHGGLFSYLDVNWNVLQCWHVFIYLLRTENLCWVHFDKSTPSLDPDSVNMDLMLVSIKNNVFPWFIPLFFRKC